MALTRPTFQNLNSNLTTFSDPITITNFGNVANRDIGMLFDRSQGSASNVAVIWQESTQGFRLAHTTSTGKDYGNIVVSSNANLIVGNITASYLFGNGSTLTSVFGATCVTTVFASSVVAPAAVRTPGTTPYTLASGNIQYLEVFLDGYKLDKDIDYTEVNTTAISSNISIPVGSTMEFRISK